MGDAVNPLLLGFVGWTAFVVMVLAALGLAFSSLPALPARPLPACVRI